MPKLSIISNGLVFACVAITAAICTVLAITSGDDALTKTKDSQQRAVTNCFQVADESILNQTRDYMMSIEENVVGKIDKHFETIRLITESIIVAIQMEPDQAVLEDWSYIKSQRNVLYSTYIRYNKIGVTGLGILSRKYQSILYVEDEETLHHPEGTWTHHWMSANNGTDYDYMFPGWPASKRSSWGTVEPDRGWFYPGWRRNDDLTCPNTFTATNGAEPSLRCYNDDSSSYDNILPIGLYFVPPGADNVIWTPPVQSGAYTAVLAVGSYSAASNPTEPLGTVFSGIDLRSVSIFLKELPLPGKARVFTVMRSSWFDTDLHLTSVSSGEGLLEIPVGNNLTESQTVPATNATDAIIRNTAIHIETLNGTYSSIVNQSRVGVPHQYTIPTSDNSTVAEEFFLRCVVYEEKGVDWFICLTIDREYMLGQIDNEFRTTKIEIDINNRQVDDDLSNSRTLLIILLVVTALFLMLACFLAILKVTDPILQLKDEMASVAVMKLDNIVERPPCWVSEVCGMQLSFHQMLQNLKEYRNYMPQSVLVDSDSSDESVKIDSRRSAASTLSGLSDNVRNSRRTATSTTIQTKTSNNVTTAASMEIKSRHVSLATLNIVNFLRDPDMCSTHTAYIKMILASTTASKGITDSFFGDRVLMTFNAARVCPSHCLAMVRVVQGVISGAQNLKITAAGVSGHAKCGNMGYDGMKKFTILGPLIGLCSVMERLAKSLNFTFLIDASANKDATSIYHTRLQNQLYYPKYHAERRVKLYSLEGTKEVTEEEWMYQLQSGEKQDPGKVHSAIMLDYCEGNYDDALAGLEQCTDDCTMLKLMIDEAKRTKINFISSIDTSCL